MYGASQPTYNAYKQESHVPIADNRRDVQAFPMSVVQQGIGLGLYAVIAN